ncbi:MAG TPA: ABC transporter ATP-binding protein, partial [bacterium]|nr:ABC transporter ATP-binding protein [bacterium]
MEPVIEARNLSKAYRLYRNPYGRLLEKLPWNKGKRYHTEVRALQDVTFEVAKGECVGLVGTNGAGKSTLLKVLTGTTFPTGGSYTVRGRVTSLLELGAGFQQSFTGRTNIFLNAAMMGFSRAEAKKKVDEIIEFSELGDFIDSPIRTYSSGMKARLGFSVAISADPDMLILDEILAVGDMNFRRKCVDKIMDYKRRGKSLFFCSHSLYDVRQICDRAIWLRKGRMQMMADAVTVTNEYATHENRIAEGSDEMPFQDVKDAQGANHPRILGAQLLDGDTRK